MSSSRRHLLQSLGALGAWGAIAPWALSAEKIKPGSDAALIVVDVQNCFVEGGSLPVAKGAEVVPVINRMASAFANIVVTQDWHTPGHASFASAHPGKKPFETTTMPYGKYAGRLLADLPRCTTRASPAPRLPVVVAAPGARARLSRAGVFIRLLAAAGRVVWAIGGARRGNADGAGGAGGRATPGHDHAGSLLLVISCPMH